MYHVELQLTTSGKHETLEKLTSLKEIIWLLIEYPHLNKTIYKSYMNNELAIYCNTNRNLILMEITLDQINNFS